MVRDGPDGQHRPDTVAPSIVALEGHVDLIAVRAEAVLEEGGRADAIFSLPACRGQGQPVIPDLAMACGERDLPAWNRRRLQDEPGRRLPQPDLIVEGDVLLPGRDTGMIAQTIKELRPIGLGIDRVERDPLYEDATLGLRSLRIHVDTLVSLPSPSVRASSPRFASVSGSTSLGAMKISCGKGVMMAAPFALIRALWHFPPQEGTIFRRVAGLG